MPIWLNNLIDETERMQLQQASRLIPIEVSFGEINQIN